MEKNYISALEDTDSSLKKSSSLIEKYISEFTIANSSSEKTIILSKINSTLKTMEINLNLMESDIMNLQEPSNKKNWKQKFSSIKSNKKNLENKIKNLKLNESNVDDSNENENEDYLDVNKNVDLKKLTSEQVMKRGDEFVNETDKSLKNMVKTLTNGRNMIKETNKELNRQMEVMDKVQTDLNEMDGSLNRAKKNVRDMNNMSCCFIF